MSGDYQETVEEPVREVMKDIGRIVSGALPADWGFVMLTFKFGTDKGRINYISNANSDNMLDALKELVGNMEERKATQNANEGTTNGE